MHSDSEDRRLSPSDLADREGVPLTTVYQWNRLGTGPRFMRIGRHSRYKLSDVITWENARYADVGQSGDIECACALADPAASGTGAVAELLDCPGSAMGNEPWRPVTEDQISRTGELAGRNGHLD
jgi:predicted DNA-binding transcriptional regulator AlpA